MEGCVDVDALDTDEPARVASDSPMYTIFRRMAKTLRQSSFWSIVKRNMCTLAQSDATVSSACSGTDMMPFHIKFACDAICKEDCSLPRPNLKHVWSCEFNDWKAEWVARMTGVSTVYKDVMTLGVSC